MELYHRRHLLVSVVSILEMLQFTDIGITDEVVPLPPPPLAGVDSKYFGMLQFNLLILVLQMELYHHRCCHLLVSIVSILGMLQFTDIGITDGVVPPLLPPPAVDSKYSWDASIY